jgi:hypothetical protein
LDRRAGLTIVEVLVAVGILGLLAALLLPAVQEARAGAHRIQCQNHLRQLGLAISNVNEATGAFPTSSNPESGYWRLLPFVDAAALRQSLVSSLEPRTFQVPVLACPLDPIVEENMLYGDVSYYFNDGTHFRVRDPLNGFRKSSKVDTRPRDISDGLSQTVSMSERLVRPLVAPIPAPEVMEDEPRRYFFWTERRYSGSGEEALAVEQCRFHRTTTDPQFFGANALNYWLSIGYDHMLPPNHPGCYNGPEDFDVQVLLAIIPASSLHFGGVNTLMGDGSVRFMSETIDPSVWQALGTRNGAEVVSDPLGS